MERHGLVAQQSVDDPFVRQPWGKFDRAGGTQHHLAHHCADVAACFLTLVRFPVFRVRLEKAAGRPLSDRDLVRLAAVVFLHDAGKLHPGFQAKGWEPGVWKGPMFGHVREGLEIFLTSHARTQLPAAGHLRIDGLENWGVTRSLLCAVISHHGRPVTIDPVRGFGQIESHWRSVAGYDPNSAASEMGRLMEDWFPEAYKVDAAQLPSTPAFDHLVCGLTTLADWVGSDARYFPPVEALDDNYMATARLSAIAACISIGLDVGGQRQARSGAVTFEQLTGFVKPNAQQQLVGDSSPEARVLILEAETGSGKTEAALWRYAQLFSAGQIDGLYFAVPTRAAAVQLHRRVHEAALRLFGSAAPETVLAVPGYLRAGAVGGKALPHWRVLWDDAEATEVSGREARWAAEHSKRYLAAPIAVGTVDQAMLGALKVKHAHLRASSMARSLLVIDEVHASDRYMSIIQKRLLESHLAVGGYAMLMSATLGSSARSAWLGHAAPKFDAAVAVPYPAVWTSGQARPAAVDGRLLAERRSKSVAMELLPSMAPGPAAERALAAARDGARVLVIRNTVKRAVETLSALEAIAEPADQGLFFKIGGKSTLHHSRFAPSDRKLLDGAVEHSLSTAKHREPRGLIVIGTQTLEQSLDIDADILLTDLCPADVLLQRIGRLHRHALARPPGYQEARCIVMAPEQGLEPLLAPNFENGLGAWRDNATGGLNGVYRDLSILELTRLLIVDNPIWSIPDMNRLLVESATHPERKTALLAARGADWERYDTQVIGCEIADALHATGALIDRKKPFEEQLFPREQEERIRTRLGEEGGRIVFAEPHPTGPFGEPVSEVVLPAHWSRGLILDDSPVTPTQADGTVTFDVDGVVLKYDRFGVARQ